jgi:hypothetical protein
VLMRVFPCLCYRVVPCICRQLCLDLAFISPHIRPMKNNREYMGVIEHETVDTHETISSVDTQNIHKKRASMKAIREEKANQPHTLDHYLDILDMVVYGRENIFTIDDMVVYGRLLLIWSILSF